MEKYKTYFEDEENGNGDLEEMRHATGFYDKENTTFRNLGVNPKIDSALMYAGITRPAYI